MALRINPRLGEHARSMRAEPTPLEAKLWSRLRSSQLGGLKFRRQIVIGSFIVDFLCPAIGLIVEVDGDTHDAEADARRDRKLADRGFTVMRFTNGEVGANLEGVLEAILMMARSLPARFTHPNPVARPCGVGITTGNPSTMPGAWLTPKGHATLKREGL